MFVFNYDEEKDLYTINDVDEDNGTSTIVYSFEQLEPFDDNDTTFIIKEKRNDSFYKILSLNNGQNNFYITPEKFISVSMPFSNLRIVKCIDDNTYCVYDDNTHRLNECLNEITTFPFKNQNGFYMILRVYKTGEFELDDNIFEVVGKSIEGFRIVETPYSNLLYFYNEENGKLSDGFKKVCPYVNGKAIVRKNIFSKYYVMDKKFNVLEHGDIHGFDNFYYADGDENFQIIQHTKNSRFYFINKQGVVSPECYNVKLLSDIDMISYQKDPDSPVLYLDAIGNINESSKYGEMLYKYKTGVKKLEDIPNIYFLNTSFKNAVINFHKEQYNLEVNAKIANDEDVDTEQDKVYLQEFKEYIESRVEKAKEEIKQKEASKAKQDATRKTASDIANSILTTDEN